MTIDMSKYLGLFVTEATEHLEALGQDLVALEKEPGRERPWTPCSATPTR